MARVVLASALARWLPDADDRPAGEIAFDVAGSRLDEVLGGVFERYPRLRGYVVDEHGTVRHHVALFVDGDPIRDKRNLAQPLRADAEVVVMQALSGG